MPDKHMKKMVLAMLVIASFACCALSTASLAFAAAAGDIDLGQITVAPARLSPGQHPNIEARVGLSRRAAGASRVVNVIAVVTRPDNRSRSWNWKKVRVSKDAARTITVPKEYETSVVGAYRVEILVYSDDMKRRLARRTRTFDVADRREARGKKGAAEDGKGPAVDAGGKGRERAYLGLGLYGNTLNLAGGGMVLLWPSKNIGIEGIYTTGDFTSYEGRLIGKIGLSQAYSVYGGIGYIHVTKDESIIGVPTRFSDSSVSGVVGVEAALGRRMLLYVEASGSAIELEKNVASGAQTVKATVEYAPVTIGIGLVMTIF
jgi:hypothetical protein